MSASGTAELLSTAAGVQEVARVFLSIDLPLEEAAGFTNQIGTFAHKSLRGGWMGSKHGTSCGPVALLKNQLYAAGVVGEGLAGADDDILPVVFVTKGRKSVAQICNVARSRMFRTPLVVEPIDLNAYRVAGRLRLK
ncbi:MAG: hypothetical protein IT367_13885 [Candidatus Hydrogenedentes bacterium]|nr:hypothetical protein [Candidatus Hydrogenedentota bacterium]